MTEMNAGYEKAAVSSVVFTYTEKLHSVPLD